MSISFYLLKPLDVHVFEHVLALLHTALMCFNFITTKVNFYLFELFGSFHILVFRRKNTTN